MVGCGCGCVGLEGELATWAQPYFYLEQRHELWRRFYSTSHASNGNRSMKSQLFMEMRVKSGKHERRAAESHKLRAKVLRCLTQDTVLI